MLRAIALGVMLSTGLWQAAPAQKIDVTGAWTVTITIAGAQRPGLAISRGRQENKPGWVARRKEFRKRKD